MRKLILVYYVDDYPDNGGGYHYEELKTEAELDKRVEEIYKNRGELIVCGYIIPFEYKPVEIVTKVERI